MKWKRGPTEFLSEKTFLIIKDDLEILKGAGKKDSRKSAPKNVANIGTWPPKMKRVQVFCESIERPKTANLEKPSVLDPALVDKLDMSLLSKELLSDSMTRFHRTKLVVNRSTLSSLPSVRRHDAVIAGERTRTATSWTHDVPVNRKRRSFEQIYEQRICQMEIDSRSPNKQKSPIAVATQEAIKRNSDTRKLDDNNNRNGPTKVLSTVRKRSSRTAIPGDLEIFMSVSARSAPEPCKTCGRPDQPERFHSHPKGNPTKIKEVPPTAKPKTVPMPKSIQKPVALNFRSDKNKNKLEQDDVVHELKSKPINPQERPQDCQSTRPSSAPIKKGPRTVTCYICARDFGTASFPIHEPKCMEKWERENNLLPPSQRRPKPQRPTIEIDHSDWNAVAWERSQEQLIPCAKCGRTFLPERLPIHQRSCKVIPPKNNELKLERPSISGKQSPSNARVGPPTVPCQICGRRFGTRSIKIHEPQCNRRWQNESTHKNRLTVSKQNSATSSSRESSSTTYPLSELSQKKTVTCYICGRDFGSSSIAIHEPQCLKKWHAENDKLSPVRRRKEPQKPEIVYANDPHTGSSVIDPVATAEANWMSHLSQLVPCKRCARTFNPDRVNVHEKNCKGNR